jgi:hypothetical protein
VRELAGRSASKSSDDIGNTVAGGFLRLLGVAIKRSAWDRGLGIFATQSRQFKAFGRVLT